MSFCILPFDHLPHLNSPFIHHPHKIDPAGHVSDVNLCFGFGDLVSDNFLPIKAQDG